MHNKPASTLYVYMALGTGVLILGFSAIFVRLAGTPGTVAAFYRMSIATSLVTLPYLYRTSKQARPFARRAIWTAILGGVFFSLDLTLWATGITLSGATNPTLLANTAPLWVGLGSWLIFGERQKKGFWSGLVLAMIGATIVLGQDLSRTAEFGLGTFLGLLAAIFYGAYYLVTQRGRASLDTLSYFWTTGMSSSVLLLALNLVLRQQLLGYNRLTWLSLLALGIIVQLIGWMVINYAQGYLPASIVAPTLLGQPVITALFAGLLLGETFSAWHILGGIAVLSGVYIVHRSRWQTMVH